MYKRNRRLGSTLDRDSEEGWRDTARAAHTTQTLNITSWRLELSPGHVSEAPLMSKTKTAANKSAVKNILLTVLCKMSTWERTDEPTANKRRGGREQASVLVGEAPTFHVQGPGSGTASAPDQAASCADPGAVATAQVPLHPWHLALAPARPWSQVASGQ